MNKLLSVSLLSHISRYLDELFLQLNLVLLESSDTAAIEEVNLAYQNVKEVDCLDVAKEGLYGRFFDLSL